MISKKLYGNIMWNTFGSIFYSFCQWLMTVVVVHIASYEDAGFLSIAMTTSSSFSAIALFSMRNYQVSDLKNEYSVNEYVGSRLLTCTSALVTCTMASLWKNTAYMSGCICAFMVIRIAEALADVLHGQDQKYDRYEYIGISYFLRGAISIVMFMALLKFNGSLLTTLVIVSAGNILFVVLWDVLKTYSLEKFRPVISKRVMMLLKSCVPIVVFSFLLSYENLYPKTVMSRLLGNELLGVYSTIATPTLVVQVTAMVAFNPLLPQVTGYYQRGDYSAFRRSLMKLLAVFAGLTAVAFLGAALLGRPVLSVLFGEGILEHYNLFLPIIAVTVLTGAIWVVSAILVGMRENMFLVVSIIICFIINVCMTGPSIESFGMNGASIAQIVPHAALLILMVARILMCTSEGKRHE